VAYLLKARSVEPKNSRCEVIPPYNDREIVTKLGVTAVAMEQLSKYARNSGRAMFSVIRAATVLQLFLNKLMAVQVTKLPL
jgi:hypothetical protein